MNVWLTADSSQCARGHCLFTYIHDYVIRHFIWPSNPIPIPMWCSQWACPTHPHTASPGFFSLHPASISGKALYPFPNTPLSYVILLSYSHITISLILRTLPSRHQRILATLSRRLHTCQPFLHPRQRNVIFFLLSTGCLCFSLSSLLKLLLFLSLSTSEF